MAAHADHSSPSTAGTAVYLVTLRGPGTSGVRGAVARVTADLAERERQDRVLAAVGDPTVVYRWTTALDGFAARLSPDQAQEIAALPSVAMVERNEIRPLATTSRQPLGPATYRPGHPNRPGRSGRSGRTAPQVGPVVAPGPRRGGRGVVIAMVDSGIAPDSPLFARLGSAQTPGFRGECRTADDWAAADCNGKVVAASSYVAGFGPGRTGSTTSLSPLDTDGHGTAMAGIAAGDADVRVAVGDHRLGRTGGRAPQAAIAVYKACWDAPEPSGDGCATADLVTAIDRAARDGADVLDLPVGGPDRIDTVEVALLGAAEAGMVVVAAAGNDGEAAGATAAHPSPWVTTVGATTGAMPRGRVVLGGRNRTTYTGAMLAREGISAPRIVLGADLADRGVRRSAAAVCAPGSLDAGRAHGAVVVCRRGEVDPAQKAEAVSLADGVAMVLLDARPGRPIAGVRAVPTITLARRTGRALLARLARPAGASRPARVRLMPTGLHRARPMLPAFTPAGDPAAGVVKPDLVAPGTGVVAAAPGGSGDRWTVVSGTSVATASVAGVAADLLARPGWTPARVRSALATTASPVRGAALLRSGTGRLRADLAARPGLAVLTPPASYRSWWEGRRAGLDVPSIVLDADRAVAHRTITNLGHRHLYFSSSATGFSSDVLVTPAAVRLAPGASARFTVRLVRRRGHRTDDGYVVWRGATGTVTRLPVVVTRR